MDGPRDKDGPRVNDEIRVSRVMVISETGEKLGVFMTDDAIELARDRGLDLIEVAPNARPPVCRLGDYGRMQYERSKKEAAARKRQHRVQLKEVKVRPKTDDHDINVKVRHAKRFLKAGNKVKITVWFRGREHAHHDIGADQCLRIAEGVGPYGTIEVQPRMEGRNMIMILAPTGYTGDGDDDTSEVTSETSETSE